MTGIPYDNAKAINRTYQREKRIVKIDYKQRYQTRKRNCKSKLRKSKRGGMGKINFSEDYSDESKLGEELSDESNIS